MAHAARQPFESAANASDGRHPLVGRDREQDLLRRQLERALAGQGGLVLVSGEAGIGKTTLVEDLSLVSGELGALVLWGHAYDLSVTPPYGPWLEILRRYRALGEQPPVPAFVENSEALARIGSQETLFAAVRDFFQESAARRPLVLVLDDLHWADQASLDFLRFLARQVGDRRILLLVTYRSDELHRDHPLFAFLPLLVREAGATRVDVRPLDEAGHRALIQQRYVLTETDQVRLEEYLARRAEGNPLYAGELLRTLEENEILVRSGSMWQLGDLAQARVPALLRQVMEGRLTRLDEATRRQLQIAAVIGPEVPLELWQEVSGAGDEALAAAIEQGQSAYLIEEMPDGNRYCFRHALFRETLYQEVIAVRRRAWHRAVAETLVRTAAPDPDHVAFHLQQAADARAAEWLVTAGERAQGAYAWASAAERFEAALTLRAQDDAPVVERVALLHRMARLLQYTDERRALALLDEARRLATDAGERALAGYCQYLRGLLQCFNGFFELGLESLAQGNRVLRPLSEEDYQRLAAVFKVVGGERIGTEALWLAFAGRLEDALSLSERMAVVEPSPRFGPLQDSSSYADGLQGLGFIRAFRGEPDAARRALQAARAFQEAIGHHFQVAVSCLVELDYVQLRYFPDELGQRKGLALEGEAAAQRAMGAVASGISPRCMSLPLLVVTGAWREAREAAATAYRAGNWSFHVIGGAWLAQVSRAQGDADLVRQVIDDLLPDGPRTVPGYTFLSAALSLQLLAAECALDAGDPPAARTWLEAHDRWLDWSGASIGRAEGALLWARYHHAESDLPRAREEARKSLAHASDPRQPLVLIAIHRFHGQLDREERRFDAAEEHLRESLHLASACDAPFERALTQMELVELRMAQGRQEDARALLADVRVIGEHLEARPMLERVAALEARGARGARPDFPAGLTTREIEVLRLVAQGLTDAEVANRLYLSSRTVSQHLRSVYSKLGVSSRTAAARFALENGLL